jgi:hypothetical protein
MEDLTNRDKRTEVTELGDLEFAKTGGDNAIHIRKENRSELCMRPCSHDSQRFALTFFRGKIEARLAENSSDVSSTRHPLIRKSRE